MKRQNYFRMIAMFAAVFAMACVSACSDKDEPEPNPEVPENPEEPVDYSRGEIELDGEEEAFAVNFNRYAFKTYRLVAEQIDADETTLNDNVVFSPMGVSYVSAMLANAAEGEIRQEVLDTYNHSGLSIDVLNKFHHTLMTSFPVVDRSASVALANSVWIRQKYQNSITSSFYDRMKSYTAEVNFLTDFGNMDEVEKINDWANENTFGFLPKLFPLPLSSDICFMLVNTLYFKGAWATEFDVEKTDKATFHNLDGTESEVDMMHHDWLNSVVFSADRFTMLKLPYGNGAYSMDIFLPKPGVSLDECLSDMELAQDDLRATAMYGGEGRDMVVSLPKFDVACNLNLLGILESLGIEKAFDFSDWAGLFEKGTVRAYLSGAGQVVRIAVDEKKSEAAAITYVDGSESPYDPIFTCDRPFVFMIREMSTGLPLFMGRVTKL